MYTKTDADKVKQSKVADVLVQIIQVKWPLNPFKCMLAEGGAIFCL